MLALPDPREFLPELFKKVRSTSNKMPGYWADDPVDVFKEHVWINPFWEDDVHEVIDCMGADRVVFGSDWPHIEALPEPRLYQLELEDLDPAEQELILNDNTVGLLQRRPT